MHNLAGAQRPQRTFNSGAAIRRCRVPALCSSRHSDQFPLGDGGAIPRRKRGELYPSYELTREEALNVQLQVCCPLPLAEKREANCCMLQCKRSIQAAIVNCIRLRAECKDVHDATCAAGPANLVLACTNRRLLNHLCLHVMIPSINTISRSLAADWYVGTPS